MRLKFYLKIIWARLFSLPRLNVLFNLFAFQLSKMMKISKLNYYPISLVVSATKRCNFTCEFCFVENYMNESEGQSGDLSFEDLNQILKTPYGEKALRIGFLGGEPFLNKNIFEYFEMLNSMNKIITVVTNSSILKGEILNKLIHAKVDAIGLSLYDNNVEDVRRVSLALRGRKVFWIQTIINSENYRKMESVINFCLNVGCESLIFDNYYPKTDERVSLTLFDDNENYKSERLRLKKIYKNKINITWVPLVQRNIFHKKCQLPFSYIQVDNEGTIGPCCVRAPEKKYGNIFDKVGWNNDEMSSVRNGLRSDSIADLHPDCRYCQCLSDDLYNI